MIKIGMIIAGRYEILEKIGTGGMSDVYKAQDHSLSRPVAVKVLKQEFADNENFVSKFRVEAQAAAGLSHPNIVNVYDVGEENGIHYIVMELVNGYTLKQYIEKKQRLNVKEAVSITARIAMGIEVAHNNHIIHRDIKPQNIIVSMDGEVKVTDFGIAKAATSNTITSNVMGSVHYTSPEQARGGFSDERSDIYSLGITLYEMLTGHLPFNGDTTVTIAIKHIQDPMPSTSVYVDDVPASVEHIIAKCCQKSPDRRYQSMKELLRDLTHYLRNPEEDIVEMVDPDQESATRDMTEDEMKAIRSQSAGRWKDDEELRLSPKSRDSREKYEQDSQYGQETGGRSGRREVHYYEDDYPEEDYPEEDYPEDEYDYEYDEKDDYHPGTERLTTIIAIIAAILIGLLVIFFVGRAFGMFRFGADAQTEEEEGELITIPDLKGLNMEEAKKQLIGLGLTPEIQYQESTSADEGVVLSSDPAAGTEVEKDDTVVLMVSAGSNMVDVPNVTGLSQAEARSTLEQYGFEVSFVEAADSNVEAGYVSSQNPAGGEGAPAGSTITVYISNGTNTNDKVHVPDVRGKSEMDARVILTESGLNVTTVSEIAYEDEAFTDLVCGQSLEPGSYADKGADVSLQVSIGPKAATYSFMGNIGAPTEDIDYVNGVACQVVVVAADGTQLLSTNTSDFPIPVNTTGIKASTGTITFSFTITSEDTVVTDPETGETITEPGESIEKVVTRDVEFTQE